MSTSTEHYRALRRDSDSTYYQVRDGDKFLETLTHPKISCVLSPSSHYRYNAIIVILFTVVFVQSLWLSHIHWQLHPVELYSYNGMRLTPHKHYLAGVPTKFMSENETVANAAWDAVEAGHGDVAIDPKYAAEHGLPPTIAHPRDPSKLFYIIESYHSIHCLKVLRTHFLALKAGEPYTWSLEHDEHCFDSLRQNAMCWASDTLLYTTGHNDAGVNQTRLCRDWDALRDWATERTACYHDYEMHKDEDPGKEGWGMRLGKCDGGDDGLPRGGLLD